MHVLPLARDQTAELTSGDFLRPIGVFTAFTTIKKISP